MTRTRILSRVSFFGSGARQAVPQNPLPRRLIYHFLANSFATEDLPARRLSGRQVHESLILLLIVSSLLSLLH